MADTNAAAPEDQRFDMAIMLTDGNPTVYGPNPTSGFGTVDRNSGYTRFRELGNANASANLLKSQGTRIMAVGVGDGVDGEGAAFNLRTISGRDAYDGTNIREADYFQTQDYAQAGEALRGLVLDRCAPSVSVIKQLVPYDGTTEDAYTPQTPWEFSAETTAGTVDPESAQTSPQTGATNFDLEFDPGPVDVAIEETQQSGYESLPEETTCVDKATGEDVPVEVTPDPDNPERFTIEGIGLQSFLSCTVYNRAPDFDSASVRVDKQWQVTTTTGPDGETTTTTYPQGQQPPGLTSSLELGGPGGAPSATQPWGVARDGYSVEDDGSVAVTEQAAADPTNCEITGSSLNGTDITPGAPTSVPLASGANEWTITNEIECHSRLRLTKEVASGDVSPEWWQLQGSGPEDALPGPSGRVTTDWAEVTPGAVYQLAEQADATEPDGPAPHDVLHYVQQDHRSTPLQFPQSTGSWGCRQTSGTGGGAFSADLEGAIAVPLGEDVECTAVNQTATVTVDKQVEGGDAQPEDFTFRITPQDPVPPGGHSHDIAGGGSQNIRPEQPYELTELNGPNGYRLQDLTCTTAGEGSTRQVDPQNLQLPPGATSTCTAVNRLLSTLTVEKLDAEDERPLAGGEFELYRDTDGDGEDGMTDGAPDPDDEQVGTCTTSGEGTCEVGELDFGDYYWYERTAPDGYDLPADRTSALITIDEDNAGQPHTTTFTDSRTPVPPDPTDPTTPPGPTDPTAPPQPSPPGGGGPGSPGNGGPGDGGPGDGGPGSGDGPHGTDNGADGLPDTGADIGVPLALGVAFLVAGAALTVPARRRRQGGD